MGEQEKWPIQSGKIPPCTAPKPTARAKRTISHLSLANGSGVQGERERAGQVLGPGPHTEQGLRVAGGCEKASLYHRIMHGGSPGERNLLLGRRGQSA